jgi:hypothetical protein
MSPFTAMVPGLFEKVGLLCSVAGTVGAFATDNAGVTIAMLPIIIGGVSAAIWGARQKGNNQALKDAGYAWREERDAERAKADRLELEKVELQHLIDQLRNELSKRPDVGEIVHEIRAGNEALVAALAQNTEAVRFLATNLAAS